MVPARHEVVLSKMYFGLDNGELVAEVAELVVLATESLDFGSGVPIIEIGNGASECVVGGGWAIEERVEPCGDGLGDVL